MHLLSCSGNQRLMLGNEAIARGALESGAEFFSCYPGTPSSEVMDSLASTRDALHGANEPVPYSMEYSVNEKVALETAIGAALAGVKSMACMKHVGLNVAADPLFTAAYIGLPGGLVILSADDPGCHSSQNEQDNRHYARAAQLPCFEPASPQEALDMTRAAFKIARELQQPVLLRTTTRVNHMSGPVEISPLEKPDPVEFQRNPGRFVPVPAVAKKRHVELIRHMAEAAELAENSPFNKVRYPDDSRKAPYGVIASGAARDYLADALMLDGWDQKVAVLELGMTWPLPKNMIGRFIASCGKILILEEGEALLEKEIMAIAHELGLSASISGKNDTLTPLSEFSTRLVRQRLGEWMNGSSKQPETSSPRLPARPPNLCPGCAHRTIYHAVKKVFGSDAIYSNDIGCYTLGMLPPLQGADFMVCMGSSVSAGSGFAKASKKTVVGFIGDSTFFHSGMTGLLNAVFNNHDILLVIMDNGTTAMTGHQPNPGVHQDVLGCHACHMDIAQVVAGLGVKHYEQVKGGNFNALVKALERLRGMAGVRVLIATEPCMLFARKSLKIKRNSTAYVKKQGAEAEQCVKDIACPAFYRKGDELHVNSALCSGCMLCLQIAPKAFGSRPRES